ncbi:NlpC/P60 family protein [Mycobacterium sp. NPDC003323]
MGSIDRPLRMSWAILLVSALTVSGHGLASADPNQTQPGTVATLVGDVARADQNLADLQAGIHSQQEIVMKALHELERARDAADIADRTLEAARQQTQQAADVAGRTQQRFDEFAASQYVNGPASWPISASNPEQILDAGATQQTLALAFTQARTDLQRARIEQANTESSARQARAEAGIATTAAQDRYDQAVQTLRTTKDAFAQKQVEIETAADQARATRQRLDDALRSSPAPAPGAPESSWDVDPARQQGATQWSQTIPIVPGANLQDPVAIINSVLQISAASAQITADLGRRFLVKLGLIPASAPATAAAPGGRIPRLYGRQAIEFSIRRGMSQMGVPYSWGGGNAGGPTNGIDQGAGTVGFDCSGLMVYAFAGVGIDLPKYSGAQYDLGRRVPVAEMRRGDLLFWGPGGSQHVALYLGQGQMLESPFTGSQVRIAPVRPSGMTTHVVRLIES